MEKYTITRAAKVLRIKRPTAKIILKRYATTGTYFNKKVPQNRMGTKTESSLSEEKRIILQRAIKEEQESSEENTGEKESQPLVKVEENELEEEQMPHPICPMPVYSYYYFFPPVFDMHSFL